MPNPNNPVFIEGQHDQTGLRPDDIASWDQLQAELQHTEEPLEQARLLTEVDQLNRSFYDYGVVTPEAQSDMLVNFTTAVQEASQRYAISPSYRERKEDGEYYWRGQTTVETAESGRKWYKSAAALMRLTVEIDEAYYKPAPGLTSVLISPRMTSEDADIETARADHLADDDAVRIRTLDIEGDEIRGMALSSLLISDIPLKAWVRMANDPNGLFQGRVNVREDIDSALPIMQAHREMHLPSELLPDGALSVVEAVLPYIEDLEMHTKVAEHIRMFKAVNQKDAYSQAEMVARRWLDFEMDLAKSVREGIATPGVLRFIASVRDHLSAETNALLAQHFSETHTLTMTRELAASLEAARRNTLWGSAAILAGDQEVLSQLPKQDAQRVLEIGLILQMGDVSGFDAYQRSLLEAESNQIIARNNIRVGRGCPGLSEDVFNQNEPKPDSGGEKEEKQDLKGTIRCIKCRQYVPKNKVVKKACWECPKCMHKVDICNGEILREGVVFGKTSEEMAKQILQPLAVDGLARRIKETKQRKAAAELQPA